MGNKIDKELAEIAPLLASLEKSNPFSVPEGYFSSLENRVMDALDKKPVLNESAPSGYFDNLSDRVLERIQTEEKPKVIPLYRNKWLAIAASFIVLIAAGFLINGQLGQSNSGEEFALDYEPEEALEYLIENENLYLSDLISIDLYEDEEFAEESTFTEFDDVELDELLNELDPEDLEELL